MLKDSFRMAVKAVSTNKMRAFLTMLGIIIGVMALVVLVSLASGTSKSVEDSISSLGTNTLTVEISDNKGKSMTLAELDELRASSDAIYSVSPVTQEEMTTYSSFSKEFSGDTEEASTTVYGTTGSYEGIAGLELVSGRYFNSSDVDNHTNVAIISSDLASDIMGGERCVGETIKVGGVSYEIIGVLEADDSTSSGGMGPGGRGSSSDYKEYSLYMPYTSLLRLSDSASSSIDKFIVSASSDEEIDMAKSALTSYMQERSEGDEDAFTIKSEAEIASAMEDVQNQMAMMLGGIAAISLIVGGIGIMNVMLVSVTERTREIGIRKAIGAKRSTIMLQFLIEAVMVSLMGCMIGIIGSWLTVGIMTFVSDSAYTLSPGIVLVAIAFSTLIGVAFGIYPASKAAKKDPIECLRYTG